MKTISNYCVDLMLRSVLTVLKFYPYDRRIQLGGKVMTGLIAPFTDMRKRILSNLEFIYPSMENALRLHICEESLDNFGRMFAEFYSFQKFHKRASYIQVSGEGLDQIVCAQEQGRPVILVSGHFGNFHACPAYLRHIGYKVAVIFHHMRNEYFDEHYVRMLKSIGDPTYARDRKGGFGFVKHIKKGGIAAVLNDQHDHLGEHLNFMNKSAKTSLATARIAIQHDALLVPAYGIRRDDGINFKVVFERAIESTDAKTMTQELNNSLEKRIHDYPSQWFWVHRRWK